MILLPVFLSPLPSAWLVVSRVVIVALLGGWSSALARRGTVLYIAFRISAAIVLVLVAVVFRIQREGSQLSYAQKIATHH